MCRDLLPIFPAAGAIVDGRFAYTHAQAQMAQKPREDAEDASVPEVFHTPATVKRQQVLQPTITTPTDRAASVGTARTAAAEERHRPFGTRVHLYSNPFARRVGTFLRSL